jgi:hypothetical protein
MEKVGNTTNSPRGGICLVIGQGSTKGHWRETSQPPAQSSPSASEKKRGIQRDQIEKEQN